MQRTLAIAEILDLVKETKDVPTKVSLLRQYDKEARTLPLYLYGNRPDLKKHQRENLFIGLLESLHPKDAALLIAVKDKKVEGLNIATINEAFPGLIPNEQNS